MKTPYTKMVSYLKVSLYYGVFFALSALIHYILCFHHKIEWNVRDVKMESIDQDTVKVKLVLEKFLEEDKELDRFDGKKRLVIQKEEQGKEWMVNLEKVMPGKHREYFKEFTPEEMAFLRKVEIEKPDAIKKASTSSEQKEKLSRFLFNSDVPVALVLKKIEQKEKYPFVEVTIHLEISRQPSNWGVFALDFKGESGNEAMARLVLRRYLDRGQQQKEFDKDSRLKIEKGKDPKNWHIDIKEVKAGKFLQYNQKFDTPEMKFLSNAQVKMVEKENFRLELNGVNPLVLELKTVQKEIIKNFALVTFDIQIKSQRKVVKIPKEVIQRLLKKQKEEEKKPKPKEEKKPEEKKPKPKEEKKPEEKKPKPKEEKKPEEKKPKPKEEKKPEEKKPLKIRDNLEYKKQQQQWQMAMLQIQKKQRELEIMKKEMENNEQKRQDEIEKLKKKMEQEHKEKQAELEKEKQKEREKQKQAMKKQKALEKQMKEKLAKLDRIQKQQEQKMAQLEKQSEQRLQKKLNKIEKNNAQQMAKMKERLKQENDRRLRSKLYEIKQKNDAEMQLLKKKQTAELAQKMEQIKAKESSLDRQLRKLQQERRDSEKQNQERRKEWEKRMAQTEAKQRELENTILENKKQRALLEKSGRNNEKVRKVINRQWSNLEKLRPSNLAQYKSYIQNFTTTVKDGVAVPGIDFANDHKFVENLHSIMSFHNMILVGYPRSAHYFVKVNLDASYSNRYRKSKDFQYLQSNFSRRGITVHSVLPHIIRQIKEASGIYRYQDGQLSLALFYPSKTDKYLAWKCITVCKKYGYQPKDVAICRAKFQRSRTGYWSLIIEGLILKNGGYVPVEDYEKNW